MTRIRSIRSGSNAIRAWAGKPMASASKFIEAKNSLGKTYLKEVRDTVTNITLAERRKNHLRNHPNDNNSKNNEKGIFWGKKGKRDKELKQFYKEHIYTFVDENDLSRKEWVRVAGFRGEEE